MTEHSVELTHCPKVVVKDFYFSYGKRTDFGGLLADFVDLAVVVYVADRLYESFKEPTMHYSYYFTCASCRNFRRPKIA